MSGVIERLARLGPASVEELTRLRAAALSATDPARLELSRHLLAARLGARDALAEPRATAGEPAAARAAAVEEWTTSALFDAEDRAFLAFTEQFSTSVAHVSDDEVRALLEYASEQEVFDFVVALYVIEMEMRVSIVARAMLTPREVSE